MAIAMKDKGFAQKCRTLFEQGSNWMDKNLFNGEYYEHKITDPETFEYLDMNNPNVKIPSFQLGPGCLLDQLVGQYMSHLCGLGYLGNKDHIQTTMNSIMKYNYVSDFSRHFNNMRSYVMGNESGLLMASWPKGRLEVPFPYFAEVMTGFEYCAAVGMIYEGMEKKKHSPVSGPSATAMMGQNVIHSANRNAVIITPDPWQAGLLSLHLATFSIQALIKV